MDASSARMADGQNVSTTASPWSFGFWFAFTYLPPAPLVGWESPMR